MPKMHQGSAIGDIFFANKMIVVTFLDFPDPDNVHQSSAIGNFFASFINVYPSHIFLPMSKGIGYLLKLCANNLRKPTPPSTDDNGDRHLETGVTVWFLYLLESFSDAEPEHVRCSVSCQFSIWVSRHEVSQVQTNLT
jgi:hypothetical protein